MKSANTAWNWTIAELARKVEPMSSIQPASNGRQFAEKIMAARSTKARAAKPAKA